jgi:hypothetical protein
MSNTEKILTTHGYAILKSSLTEEQGAMIRKELTVKPQVIGLAR